MKLEKLEDGIDMLVNCHDGNDRWIHTVTPTHVSYSVAIADCFWRTLEPTKRTEIEKEFVGANAQPFPRL